VGEDLAGEEDGAVAMGWGDKTVSEEDFEN
jgi:hypothetical protein